nr:ACP S-malonyltransferase [Mycobacterium tuberculosis]
MTIHEHDRVSADRGGDSPHTTHALVDRLMAGEPYAVAFGGQGSAWLETLEELVSATGIETELATLVGEAELLLDPVTDELIVVRPIGFEPLQWVRALAAEDPVPSDKHLTSAAVSVPGVLLTQIAATRALARQGMDLVATPPVAMAGHSQGVLAVEALKAGGARDVELFALAQLIGAAGTLVARRRGISVLGDRPPMVSVTNADPERIGRLLDEFAQDVRTVLPPVLSIRNGRRAVVITGTPSSCRVSSFIAARSPRRKKPTARTRSAAATSSRRSSSRCRWRWAFTPRGYPTGSTSSRAGPRRRASMSPWLGSWPMPS